MITYPPRWELWLDTPTGARLALLDSYERGALARVVNASGAWSLSLPVEFADLAAPYHLVEFWRTGESGIAALEGVGMVLKRQFDDQGDVDRLVLSGQDAGLLLDSRIVAYRAGTSQASKTAVAADNLMKAIVRENLGASATDTARDLTSAGLTVQADLTLAPTTDLRGAWKTVREALNAVAADSATKGTPLYYELVPQIRSASTIGFEFQTFITRRGQDRSYGSDNPTVFSREWGNLDDPALEEDYSEETASIYAGGQGEGADQALATATDATRLGRSSWSRRERFVNASSEETANGLQAAANAALRDGRARLRFSGKLKSTPQTPYGVAWSFGDTVTAAAYGRQFDGMVSAVRFAFGPDGETIDAKIEVEQ